MYEVLYRFFVIVYTILYTRKLKDMIIVFNVESLKYI